jgi:excisionase family DNA binding protein
MSALSVTNSVDVATSHHPASLNSHRGEMLPRMLVSVTEASRALGVSRSFAYELVAASVLKSIRLGRRILIPVSALEDLIATGDVEH